jgi:small redox-active disulfide protein 2
MLSLKVLGSGCANCNRLEANAKQAVTALGVEAAVDHVRDMAAIMAYGVMRTPALVVNEKVVVSGRVPTPEELTTMIANVLA